MTIYLAAKFLHIAGALALFSTLGLEIAFLRDLTRAQSATAAQAALAGLNIQMRIGLAAMLLILLPGGYLACAAWGMPAWLLAAIGAMLAIIAVEATATRKSLAALLPALQRGADMERVGQLRRRLWSSFAARVVLLLGISALMSMKPDWHGAVSTLAVTAGAAALAASFAQRESRRASQQAGLAHK